MDKFYTCDKIVEDILRKIKENVSISDHDLVLEPSAGDGGRSGLITEFTNNCNVNCFYFINFERDFDIAALQSISWDDCRDNTAGPRSISKRELILKFNEVV